MLSRRRLLAASSAAATAYVAYASCEKGPDRFGLTHPYRPEPAAEGTPQPTESPSPSPRSSSTRRPRVLVTGFHDWRDLESNLWRCARSACARCAHGVRTVCARCARCARRARSRRGTRRARPRAPCRTPHAPCTYRCRDNPSCRVLYGAPSASPPIEKAGPLVRALRAPQHALHYQPTPAGLQPRWHTGLPASVTHGCRRGGPRRRLLLPEPAHDMGHGRGV